VRVEVDGVMYISIVEPEKAAYGITDYRQAAMQLAQTTTRSVIGTIDLDQTFEERMLVSSKVVHALSEAGHAWGIRVHRYEIKNIAPPPSVRNAMEKQVTAERERRAMVAKATGERQARINKSEGERMELVNRSEGEKQRQINEAEGNAAAMLAVAQATADSISKVAAQLNFPGGDAAIRLQLIERYVAGLGRLANPRARVVLPADLGSFDSLLQSAGLSPAAKA
jgi:regulator of protease activity HflC (stomatin/prohibitin superfamily)